MNELNRTLWPYTTVDQAMRPLAQLPAVTPDTPVTEAIEIMSREEMDQLPVVRDGQIAGVISRGGVLRLLQTQAALDM